MRASTIRACSGVVIPRAASCTGRYSNGMVAGLRQLGLAAAAVFCIALALPALAVASGGGKCNASACKVYVEPGSQGAGKQPTPTRPPQTGPGGSSSTTHQPKKLARVLSEAGRDRGPLTAALGEAGPDSLQGGSGNVAGPSLLGAALDLGAGPLALLAILLASALALGAHGVMRNRRRGRPTA